MAMASLHHRRLVQELAALPAEERQAVVRGADTEANRPDRNAQAEPTLPWSTLRAAIGIMRGEPADAVVDSEHLYDG